MKISEILTLKKVRPVIQLDRDMEEACSTFVWTADLKRMLFDFHKRLGSAQGGGIFLKGHYGSGKSHLLSYLAGQVSDWKYLKETFGHISAKHEAVSVSLVRWGASVSLEDAVISTILKNHPSLESINRSDRNDFFYALHKEILSKEKKGVVILLDELSEFLGSRDSGPKLREDIRFLQYLAEFFENTESWVIGAIQEEIEGLGAVSRDISLKLKDRFAIRWNLGSFHIEQMIGERLFEKKDGAQGEIDRVFGLLQKRSARQWDADSFIRTYPLHPGTLELLAGFGHLFSEHRGALRFVQDIFCGEFENGEPFENRCTQELITADMIFDYFESRISETPYLREYKTRAFDHLNSRITELIPQNDQALAIVCIKILLLCSLDARREGGTLEEIAAFANFSLGTDPDAPQQYINEKIFGVLRDRVNYLDEKNGRYVIDLNRQAFEKLDRFVQEKLSLVNLNTDHSWIVLIPFMDNPPFDFASIFHNPKGFGSLRWMNTSRDLTLAFGADFDSAKDADIRIIYSFENPEDMQKPVLFWKPRQPVDHEKTLRKEAVVLCNFATAPAGTAIDLQAKREARRRKESETPRIRRLLEKLYLEGEWYIGKSKIVLQSDWAEGNSLESLFEQAAFEMLSLRHPRFRSIAPRLLFYNERILADIVEILVRPGEVTEAELARTKCLEAVQGIMRPLGLTLKTRARYCFVWDTMTCAIVAFFDDYSSRKSLSSLKDELKNGPFGLPENLIEFLLWCAISGGYYRAYRKGEYLPEQKISFQNLFSIDEIREVEPLDEKLLTELFENSFFRSVDASYQGLSRQRHLDTYFKERVVSALRKIDSLDLSELDSCWKTLAKTLEKHLETIVFFRECVEKDNESYERLTFLHEFTEKLSLLDEAIEWILCFCKTHSKLHADLDSVYSYIHDEFPDEIPRTGEWTFLLEDKDELIRKSETWADRPEPWQMIEQWLVSAQSWIVEYRKRYCLEHTQRFGTSDSKDSFMRTLGENICGYNIYEDSCQREVSNELKVKPFCRCGFIPSTTELKEKSVTRIDEVITLIENNFSETQEIESLINAMKCENWVIALDFLRKMLKQSKKNDQDFVLSVNSLSRKLKNGRWTRDQICNIFHQWLGKNDNSDKIYRVKE